MHHYTTVRLIIMILITIMVIVIKIAIIIIIIDMIMDTKIIIITVIVPFYHVRNVSINSEKLTLVVSESRPGCLLRASAA